jgi:PAS domain S-box-containing protein
MRQPASWQQSGFDQLEVPLIIVSVDRQIAYANPAARRLFGASPGALEGAGIDRLVVAERRGELRNIEDVLKGGSARRVRSVVRREDGGRLDVTMSVEPCLDVVGRIEAATVRYELIAASGRMSAGPGPRESSLEPRPPLISSSVTARPPSRMGIKDDSGSVLSHAESSHSDIPRHSSGPTRSGELESRLQRVAGHLKWLEERFTQPSTELALDDPRERARALMVISEAKAQLLQAMDEARSASTSVPPLPAPPKLPTL